MKIKIYNTEHEMPEEEVAKMYEHVLLDASEMQFFIHFLRRYVYITRIAGESCKGALLEKLHECLRMYCSCHQPLSKVRPELEKAMHFLEPEALRHHDFIKQKYGPLAGVVE